MPTSHWLSRSRRRLFLGMQAPGRMARQAGMAIFIWALLASPALAHKVSIFAWVDNATVYTESKFSGGRTPKDSPVIVYDLTGKKLLQGTTDNQGRYSFPSPEADGLRIVLEAGQGHQAEWTVSAEELTDAAAPAPRNAAPPASAAKKPAEKSADKPAAHSATPTADVLPATEIQAVVVAPLQQELQQLRSEVRRLRGELDAGPAMTDILGAIGYIIGLVGIGAYFKHRPRPSGDSRHG